MLDDRSKNLRKYILRMIEGGRRGHIGPATSLIELIRVFYDSWLSYRPEQPAWPERDRLILSKGHGCLALYAVLADKGFFPQDELDEFCKHNSMLGGHPETKVPGVEACTGSLGHGLSIGVGVALAAKIKRQQYKVAVIVGDGEINEGSIWEAAMSATKHKLSSLTVFVDYNKLQSYGPLDEVIELEPLCDKWKSFGFAVTEVDGHDVTELERVTTSLPLRCDKPTAVVCHTIKGKGFPFAEGNATWHHKSRLTDDEISAMYECLS